MTNHSKRASQGGLRSGLTVFRGRWKSSVSVRVVVCTGGLSTRLVHAVDIESNCGHRAGMHRWSASCSYFRCFRCCRRGRRGSGAGGSGRRAVAAASARARRLFRWRIRVEQRVELVPLVVTCGPAFRLTDSLTWTDISGKHKHL